MSDQKPKTHLVALIRPLEHYYDYDSYDTIIQSISDWEEVDEETFQLLKNASNYVTDYNQGRPFVVIERLTTKSPTVTNTVSAYVAHLAKQKAEQEAAAAAKRAKAEKRRLDKLMKDEDKRRQLYEQLQREFADGEHRGVLPHDDSLK